MTFGLALLAAGVVVPLVGARAHRGWAVRFGLAFLVGGLVLEVAQVVDLTAVGTAFERLRLPGLEPHDGIARVLLLASLVWCGPAADLVVRRALDATGLPNPEAAAERGLRAGRWIGRLERWLLVLSIASGHTALAVLPVGGKALFRYAEVAADARKDLPRLARPDDEGPTTTRGSLVDYVIVGSLASWVQAIGLTLLAVAT